MSGNGINKLITGVSAIVIIVVVIIIPVLHGGGS
jgi:hypothetical protein